MSTTGGASTLFELLPIGAYQSSPDGRQLRANAALVRLNGYHSEAQMLAAVNDIGAEWYVDPERRQQFMQAMLRDGQVLDFVSEIYRHKTRERIWINETAHLVRDAAGRVLYYEGTVEDITQQRRVELALQASERRFRALTERSQVLTVVCTAQGEAIYVSPASLWLLGRAPETLQRTSVFDWVHADDVPVAQADLAEVLVHQNSGVESVYRVLHADGNWRHLAMLANNCLADPAVAGVVLNLRDVSGRVRAAQALRDLNADLEHRVQRRTQELEQARDSAESANRAKSDFLSRMSHELRTPMNAILGFGQLLDADTPVQLQGAQRRYLHEILRAGDHLLELINELLDLSRIEAGELRLALDDVDVAQLIGECMSLIEPLARPRQLSLQLEYALPPAATVRADRTRLKQVLMNLLSNAVKHNRLAGQVHLACADDAGCLRIEVSDTGPGLTEPQQSHVFHAFERLGTPALDSAGIGLALSKRLVEMMGGQIGLHSVLGQGSSFWVRLPHDDPAAQPADRDWIDTDSPATPQHRHTLLYIEDNPVNVLLMEAMLAQQSGLRLLSAALPEQGLDLALTERPELILLDIQLPGIDGYEVLRRLRADPRTQAIPVIAISANAMPGDLRRGLAAGFDDYLTKPLDQPQLLAAVAKALGK